MTDLCIMEPEAVTRELAVTRVHPGVSREQLQSATGWPLRYAADVTDTPAPTATELEVLRTLHERTRRAHGGR